MKLNSQDKENIVIWLMFIGLVPVGLFVFYLFFGFVDWLVGDPLSIINNCPNCR